MEHTQGPDPLMWEDPEAFVDPDVEPNDSYDFEPQTYDSRREMSEKENYVRGLRDLADAIERTDFEDHRLHALRIDMFADTVEEHEALSKKLGGFREKIMDGSYAIYRRNFGPHAVDINLNRTKICERVQVGERVLPAQEERVEPVYEWVCEDESWVPAA